MNNHNHSTEKNILIAFLLNIGFSIFEILGGFFTGSIAIVSDAVHDAGDALSIGISYFLEKKSNRKSDDVYTFGYRRYSIIGALITTTILLLGSIIVIYTATKRLFDPAELNKDGMIFIAIIGLIINFFAAYFTKEGDSLNQHAVNLHMLEDVLGWFVVLLGSIIIKLTNFIYIDSIMSIGVATFLLIETCKNMKLIFDLILEKTPNGITVKNVKEKLKEIEEIKDIHHIHLWSLDGNKIYATMHIVADKNIKEDVRKKLEELNIFNVTIELEHTSEVCRHKECN